jgi:hypothetical protein
VSIKELGALSGAPRQGPYAEQGRAPHAAQKVSRIFDTRPKTGIYWQASLIVENNGSKEAGKPLTRKSSKSKKENFFDKAVKTGIYCKASLITESSDDEAARRSLTRKSSKSKKKFFDKAAKTGVYCKAPLIEAASKKKQSFLGSLKTYSR